MNDRMYDPLATTGSLTLDFPALHLWWKNGNPQIPPQQGVAHFGGWCASKTDADQTLAEMERTIPTSFSAQTYTNSKNESYQVYASRIVAVAPIIKRVGWFENDEKRQYSKVEVLAYLATVDLKNKIYVPWGPVLLTGSSFSGVAITDALALWGRKITPLTKQDEAPSWAHWAVIGTVREAIYIEQRGKNKKSPITPCEVAIPKEVTEQFVFGRFIGKELMSKLIDYRLMSHDWAASWNEKKGEVIAKASEADEPTQPPTNVPEDISTGNIPF